MRTRIMSAIFVAVVVLALTTALFNRAPGADATQGQAVIAGLPNQSTATTVIEDTDTRGCGVVLPDDGLTACGLTGLVGHGNTGVEGRGQDGVIGRGTGVGVRGTGPTGVLGEGPQAGVRGSATSGTGYGVQGKNVHGGIAVYGEGTDLHGTGVWGEAVGNETGYGVVGSSSFGVGVLARSADATALRVEGKAAFSSSGTASVAGTAAIPKSSVTVKNVALTAKSLILVTPQKNVVGAWVRAAVPNAETGRFTLYLNKNISVEFPVAWMIIEKL